MTPWPTENELIESRNLVMRSVVDDICNATCISSSDYYRFSDIQSTTISNILTKLRIVDLLDDFII